jgi:hypothetical protein
VVDLLQKASAWLEDQRTKHLTQTVVYQRGTSDTVEALATIGTTVFRLDDGTGATIHVESRDYLILVADLVLVGMPIEPKRGDQIRETALPGPGGQTLVYEVIGPGDEPCWRWSDPYRTTRRIHTKQIDTETNP